MRIFLTAITLALSACALSTTESAAQECQTDVRATLAGAKQPCARKPADKKAATEASKKKLPPGTYQSGNTTVIIDGHVSGSVTTRIK